MTEAVTYAKAGEAPLNWAELRVFDENGKEVVDVDEVNTAEGWLVRLKRDELGNAVIDPLKEEFVMERIEGNFRIQLPEQGIII